MAAWRNDMLSVWIVRSHEYADAVPYFLGRLSAKERHRAQALRGAAHRDAYIVSHYALRQILGPLLGVDHFGEEFEVGVHGKPSLPQPFAAGGLQFNLSHADGLALIAVSQCGAVGVDVERTGDIPDVHALAAMVFAASECERLKQLSAADAGSRFFRMWVRKEAYVKACGRGLVNELRQPMLDPASLGNGAGPVVRHVEGCVWSEWPIAVPDGYCAALYQQLRDVADAAVRVPDIREWSPTGSEA